MPESRETPPTLIDTIPLDQEMPPEEAVRLLAVFLDASEEYVAAAYLAPDYPKDKPVIFVKSLSNGHECLALLSSSRDGRMDWNQLIDKDTGGKIMHTG
jgi:hypothetical protein